MSKETGGQAFPRQQWEYGGQNNVLQYQDEGMTLRDYFASKVIVSLVDKYHTTETMASKAYEIADAMLKERSKL